jgi:hypothetical protein
LWLGGESCGTLSLKILCVYSQAEQSRRLSKFDNADIFNSVDQARPESGGAVSIKDSFDEQK